MVRQYPVQPPTTDSRPAPHHRHSGAPPRHSGAALRHSGEGRNPEGRRGVWQDPIQPPTTDSRPAPTIVIPAPHFVIPAPHFVIPAKAGIQRGGEGRGNTRSNHPPRTAGRPLTIVIPAPPTRHSGEGRNPEGRRGVRQPPIQPPTTDSRPAPTIVIPAPHFVIPAKAGIQRGGEG